MVQNAKEWEETWQEGNFEDLITEVIACTCTEYSVVLPGEFETVVLRTAVEIIEATMASEEEMDQQKGEAEFSQIESDRVASAEIKQEMQVTEQTEDREMLTANKEDEAKKPEGRTS